MIQMFTTSRIQETKMFTTSRIYAITNVYHLQNIGDKDAIPLIQMFTTTLEYRRQRCNMIQMFTTSRIQETKMQYDTNVYHLQNIGDKDAI